MSSVSSVEMSSVELNPQRWEKFYFPDLYIKLKFKFKLKKQEGVAEINEGNEGSEGSGALRLHKSGRSGVSGRRESRNWPALEIINLDSA